MFALLKSGSVFFFEERKSVFIWWIFFPLQRNLFKGTGCALNDPEALWIIKNASRGEL